MTTLPSISGSSFNWNSTNPVIYTADTADKEAAQALSLLSEGRGLALVLKLRKLFAVLAEVQHRLREESAKNERLRLLEAIGARLAEDTRSDWFKRDLADALRTHTLDKENASVSWRLREQYGPVEDTSSVILGGVARFRRSIERGSLEFEVANEHKIHNQEVTEIPGYVFKYLYLFSFEPEDMVVLPKKLTDAELETVRVLYNPKREGAYQDLAAAITAAKEL